MSLDASRTVDLCHFPPFVQVTVDVTSKRALNRDGRIDLSFSVSHDFLYQMPTPHRLYFGGDVMLELDCRFQLESIYQALVLKSEMRPVAGTHVDLEVVIIGRAIKISEVHPCTYFLARTFRQLPNLFVFHKLVVERIRRMPTRSFAVDLVHVVWVALFVVHLLPIMWDRFAHRKLI